MRGKGNRNDYVAVSCRENSPMDLFLILITFFKIIKVEPFRRRIWETHRQAETAIFQYINDCYKPRRRHSALAEKSPLAFERHGA